MHLYSQFHLKDFSNKDSVILRIQESPRRSKLLAHFAELNFVNKSCSGKPCGHFGIKIISLFDDFINDLIGL